MAVPFRRTSKTKKRMRRTHLKKELPGLTTCPNCGASIKPHRACPECGRHSVHGLDSTIFSTALMLAVFVYLIVCIRRGQFNYLFCLGLFAGAYFIARLADGLFFKLAKNNRIDVS